MRLGTFCSGIGAPEVAARGMMRPVFFSEIEPFPSAVLAHHWPDVPNLGDMTAPDIVERIAALGLPDVIVAGTPCQAFSVAGLRQGTKDARGNLTLKFVEIVHAIVDARPDGRLAVVWENVPGVLSDKGNAFGAFLGGLVGAMAPVIPAEPPRKGGYKRFWNRSPKRRWRHRGRRKYRKPFWYPAWPSEGMVEGPRARAAWAVLDAQWAGVAQRRRRVFVVVDFGNCVDPAAVLLEPDRLRGDTPPRREAWQDVAGTLSARTEGGGGLGTDFDLAGGIQPDWPAEVAPTLNSHSGDKMGLEDQHALAGGGSLSLPETSMCLNAGAMGRQDAETETLIPTSGGGFDVAHTLKGEEFDASEDGTGRGTLLVPVAIQERAVSENPDAGPQGAGFRQDGVAYTLEARNKVQAVAFAQHQRGELRTSDISPQLATGGGKPGEGYPAVMEPIAFDCKGTEVQTVYDGTHPTLRSMGHNQSHQNAGGHAAVAFDLRGRDGRAMPEGPHDIAQPWAVRRLTPTECARLQGFPDDHTRIPWRGKPATECPDGPQYKAYGNSMAVPVIRWIMDRIRISRGMME